MNKEVESFYFYKHKMIVWYNDRTYDVFHEYIAEPLSSVMFYSTLADAKRGFDNGDMFIASNGIKCNKQRIIEHNLDYITIIYGGTKQTGPKKGVLNV